MWITPHADAKVAPIVTLTLHAFPGGVAQPPARDHRQEARLSGFVHMHCWSNVLMCWIIAVRAGGGDFDLRLGLWLCGLAPYMGRLENYGEALPSRR